tara:strand:+ start:82889 stop:83794 length:906 start_codon:yes stop_codon:yes gene_type:complete
MAKINPPNFMCIGAAKCATTSLYNILKKHPQIGLSSFKEPHFFDDYNNFKKGKEWYLDSYYKNLNSFMALGEFTPTYLASKKAPKRILNFFGNKMKFIVILRNPVDRAYSHFLHTKRDFHEKLTFTQALENEDKRLEEINYNQNFISFLRYSYIYQSKYHLHIKNYLKFFNIKQFHFVKFEDFVNDRKNTLNKILKFLEVSSEQDLDINVYSNKSSVARSKTLKSLMKKDSIFKRILKLMIPSLVVRQKLRNIVHAYNNKDTTKPILTQEVRNHIYNEFFNKDILDLEKMLNLDLNLWKEC